MSDEKAKRAGKNIQDYFPSVFSPQEAFRAAARVIIPKIAEKNRESFECRYKGYYEALLALKKRTAFFLSLQLRNQKLLKKYDKELRMHGWSLELDGRSDELFLALTLTLSRCFARSEKLEDKLKDLIKGFSSQCAENERMNEIHPNFSAYAGIFSSFGGSPPASWCERTGVCVCKNKQLLLMPGRRFSSFDPPYTYSCLNHSLSLPVRHSD